MTDEIRREIEFVLKSRNLTRSEVAKSANLTRQYLTDMLKGRKGNVPESWLQLLDALNLELCVREKEVTKNSDS
jgi:predicted transcriptional regulator